MFLPKGSCALPDPPTRTAKHFEKFEEVGARLSPNLYEYNNQSSPLPESDFTISRAAWAIASGETASSGDLPGTAKEYTVVNNYHGSQLKRSTLYNILS
jgi:hypothetical protein